MKAKTARRFLARNQKKIQMSKGLENTVTKRTKKAIETLLKEKEEK